MEVHYLLGLSYINIGEYLEGNKHLLKIIEKDPKYDKVIYLALAQSFHKLGRIEDALEQVNITLLIDKWRIKALQKLWDALDV